MAQSRDRLTTHRVGGRRAAVVRTAAAVATAAFFAIFFAYPVVTLVVRGLTGSSRVTPLDVLGDGATWRAVRFTVWQATASTTLTMLAGLPAAWAIGRHEFRGRALVRALAVVPFVMPTVVVAAALRAAFARFGLDGGAVRLDGTVWAILLAHVIFNVAVVVRVVGGHWGLLDPRQEDAARMLGAPRLAVWREVVLPHLRPALWSAATIVFLFCFTSFGVILVVGGTGHATVETEIWRFATQRTDFTTAAVLALVQLVFVVVLVAASLSAERRAARASVRRLPRPVPVRTWRGRAALAGVLVPTLALLLLPLAVLVERSLSVGDGYGLAHYRALGSRGDRTGLLVPPLEAVGNSLRAATAATLLAVGVGMTASVVIVHGRRGVGRVVDTALMLPLGTSAVTLGFGILLALDEPPLDLRTSPVIVPIAQSIVGIPFVVRAVVPMLRAVDPRLREAAAVLGASPRRVWREIDLPIVRRALAAASGFAFAVSLGEFGATAFLARPDRPTVPVAMFRLLGRPGSSLRGQAMALGVILAALTIVCVSVIERAQRGRDVGW